MNLVFLCSILLKGVGAVLEVLLQIFITQEFGISGYGSYAAWINGADLVFWMLFSGLVKCNTFYLSGKASRITEFKRRYYMRYVIPVLAILTLVAAAVSRELRWAAVLLMTGLELAALDQSSTLIAENQPVASLIGEYILGRVILLAGVGLLSVTDSLGLHTLLALHLFQYLGVIVFFALCRKKQKQKPADISDTVSRKKWGAFQRADIMQAMIGQMPVVLQYFFSGAFEAGVVSIVLLVKKLINFISGPAAKIFLPEFSRLYQVGKREDIRNKFAAIMGLQMLFLGPMAVVLLGFPNVILRILAPELAVYEGLFTLCSAVFLTAATLGPCGGVMQMTGNEGKDNRHREAALVGMVLTMVLFSKDRLFVLYGLCVQTTMEAVGKYIFVCHWMGKAPVGIGRYIRWWLAPAAAIAAARILALRNSFWAMVFFAGWVFCVGMIRQMKCNADMLRGLIRRWRK